MRNRDKKIQRNFRLTDQDYEALKKLGAGNASDGLRFLLDAHLEENTQENEDALD